MKSEIFKLTNCILVGLLGGLFYQTGHGHEIFQEVLKEKYGLKSFACKTCHATDDRTLRTPFAETIYQVMKDGNWSEKFAQAEAEGEDAVKAFEQLIAQEFEKSLDQIGQQTMTVDQLLDSGLLVGVRVDDKKRETMERFSQQPAEFDAREDLQVFEPAIGSRQAPRLQTASNRSFHWRGFDWRKYAVRSRFYADLVLELELTR